jgi:hypothetical protein
MTFKCLSATDFAHSSTKRVVSFDVKIPNDYLDSEMETVTIDGVGRLSHPIKLKSQWKRLSSFSPQEQKTIRQTEDRKQSGKIDLDAESVILLTNEGELGQQVEQWALEYTSKFVHAAGPRFYATTMAQILGTAYVKKGLPEVSLTTTPSCVSYTNNHFSPNSSQQWFA